MGDDVEMRDISRANMEPTEEIIVDAMNKLAGVQHVIPFAQVHSSTNFQAVQLGSAEVFSKFYQYTNNVHKYAGMGSESYYADHTSSPPSMDSLMEVDEQPILYVKTLSGKIIELWLGVGGCDGQTIEGVKKMLEAKEGVAINRQLLIFAGNSLENNCSLRDYDIRPGSTLHLEIRLLCGGAPTYFVNLEQLFDARFNCDFRQSHHDAEQFYRGEHLYQRPLGCMRYAIKVLGKYDSNEWLGPCRGLTHTCSAEHEWPVAYHGTKEVNLEGILKEGLRLDKGKHFAFGRGIYCTPSPRVALSYATVYRQNAKTYKVILQSRVDPSQVRKIKPFQTAPPHEEYWLVPDGAHIRPYGVCIYEMK